MSKTEDNYLKQDASGEEWGLAGGGRHFPHFLKLTWIYDLPIGPGKAVDVNGVLGQIVGGWTMTGIHNYRTGGTISVFDSRINNPGNTGFPFRPDIVEGVDPIIFDGSHLDVVNGTPYLNPAAFATAAVVGARRAVAAWERRRRSWMSAGRRSTPRTSG